MKFYFPDSQDLVSPTYDFAQDEYSPHRVRQRDDRYAHEVLSHAPYHGILVSKSIVDGSIRGAGKYTAAQRARLYRLGVSRFFRLPDTIETMGDNGAFNYADEVVPPVSVEQTLDFYEGCGFTSGISVDHIIFGYEPGRDFLTVDTAWAERRLLTLRLAEEFRALVVDQGLSVEPVGVAQGWSPASYADSVRQLQAMGYQRIALGGMVPLRTADIMSCLVAIDGIRLPGTELHLLGITRIASMESFADLGVTSFDSTSAFRQSFMDDRKNFHTADDTFSALRIPQVEGNPTLRRGILSGRISQAEALHLERACLRAVRAYDGSASQRGVVLSLLAEYEVVYESKKTYVVEYERTLQAAPWASCTCTLCRDLGIEIAIFRGTERNKRRGFHNMSVLAAKMARLSPRPEQRSLCG